jgi:hypothetical protein
MTRRLVYPGLGVIALGLLFLLGLRATAVSSDDPAAGKKDGDVVSRLERRIAALEKRVTELERKRDRGEIKFLARPNLVPAPLGPQAEPPRPPHSFEGNWCYTILIDGKQPTTAAADAFKTQR